VHLRGGTVVGAHVEGALPTGLLAVADAANTLLFLVPLWLVAAVAMTRERSADRSTSHEHDARFSLAWTARLAVAPVVARLLVVHPAGGGAGGWDEGAGAGVVAGLVSAYALVGAWRTPGGSRALAPAVTLALAVSIALWGVHASSSMGIARLVALVR